MTVNIIILLTVLITYVTNAIYDRWLRSRMTYGDDLFCAEAAGAYHGHTPTACGTNPAHSHIIL